MELNYITFWFNTVGVASNLFLPDIIMCSVVSWTCASDVMSCCLQSVWQLSRRTHSSCVNRRWTAWVICRISCMSAISLCCLEVCHFKLFSCDILYLCITIYCLCKIIYVYNVLFLNNWSGSKALATEYCYLLHGIFAPRILKLTLFWVGCRNQS